MSGFTGTTPSDGEPVRGPIIPVFGLGLSHAFWIFVVMCGGVIGITSGVYVAGLPDTRAGRHH